VREKVN